MPYLIPMKAVFLMLLACCLPAWGQTGPGGFIRNGEFDRLRDAQDHEHDRALRIAQAQFVPQDPWRIVNGGVHYAKGDNWVQFYGTVIGQSEGKTYIHGWYGVPLEYEHHLRVFCVSNLPAAIVGENLLGSQNLTALNTFRETTYYSSAFGAQPCMLLDYGAVYIPPPPTPDQIAASNAAAAAVKAQADAVKERADGAALKYDEDLAAKGDAFGELRMGERYRDGDGVVKDLIKARQMFSASADQGNPDAAKALANFPAP